jgi:gamma-glutamyltranspeptidase/glutathione hydrolase
MPPPSAGGLLLVQTLSLFSKDELHSLGFNTPAYQHALAEAFRAALADRMRYVGDPDFEPVALDDLVAAKRMKRRRERISLDRTHALPRFGLEEHGTHHLVTGDADGNVVSLTTTVNRAFGAKLTAPQSGVVLNDELDDFTLQTDVVPFGMTQSPNRPGPGKRPTSSMTPTIVVKDGTAVLAAGGSGGMTIGPNVAQAVIARLAFDLPLQDILDAPRFQIPPSGSTILLQEGARAEDIKDLERRGEIVGTVRFNGSAVQLLGSKGAIKTAAADPRKFGSASVK